MNDERISCLNNLLDQNSHKNLVQPDPDLFDCQKGSFIKFRSPNPFDGHPRFRELWLRDAECNY